MANLRTAPPRVRALRRAPSYPTAVGFVALLAASGCSQRYLEASHPAPAAAVEAVVARVLVAPPTSLPAAAHDAEPTSAEESAPVVVPPLGPVNMGWSLALPLYPIAGARIVPPPAQPAGGNGMPY